jgi:hypothetical protein
MELLPTPASAEALPPAVDTSDLDSPARRGASAWWKRPAS